MTPCLIHCVKPGLWTTVQDLGRYGFQKFGVPVGGAMDKRAAQMANYLVGNAVENPVLEITMAGPTLRVEGTCQIAITGAHMEPKIDGSEISNDQTHVVGDGSIISFGKLEAGCRAYLAIGGEWRITKWLGSASAPIRDADRTTPDSILKKNSCIKVLPRENIKPRRLSSVHFGESPLTIRVLPGPEFDDFSNQAIGHFFSLSHRISSQSNRMGYRLASRIKYYQAKQELISSGCLFGTIQVTNEGQAIVLMADAQTTGGYPRIAQVILVDLSKLAQAKPGDDFRFVLTDLDSALQALKEEKAAYPFLAHR